MLYIRRKAQLDINILFAIVISILASGAVWGWKKGLIESVINIISCVLGIVVLVVTAKGVGSFIEKNYVKVVAAVSMLLAIRIVHRTVRFLAEAFRLVRKVPGGKTADKLTGAVFGLASSVFAIWLLFLLAGIFDVMGLNAWITAQVERNWFLRLLYYSNYLTELLREIAG